MPVKNMYKWVHDEHDFPRLDMAMAHGFGYRDWVIPWAVLRNDRQEEFITNGVAGCSSEN